ncbi:hypothetical protein ACXR0O_15745 [Verrucomicrobiota bacterium sgz303538]
MPLVRFAFNIIAVTCMTCLGLTAQVAAQALIDPTQEAIEANPVNVLVEMQIVALPQNIAVPLVRDLMDAQKVDKAYEQVQQLLSKETAKLIAWPIVTTKSGERAVVEGINEFRFATEYTAGDVGIFLDQRDGTAVRAPTEVNGVDSHVTPSAFETRNVGVTLEVAPILRPDRKTIELNIVPQHVRLKGMNKITAELKNGKETITVEQPEFDKTQTSTTLSVKSGERKLMGVFPTSNPPNHLELFLLRAEVQIVP